MLYFLNYYPKTNNEVEKLVIKRSAGDRILDLIEDWGSLRRYLNVYVEADSILDAANSGIPLLLESFTHDTSHPVDGRREEREQTVKDYTGRFVSIAENVAEFLDKEIDHPLKDFTLTELISHAQEFKKVTDKADAALDRLIWEMKGH